MRRFSKIKARVASRRYEKPYQPCDSVNMRDGPSNIEALSCDIDCLGYKPGQHAHVESTRGRGVHQPRNRNVGGCCSCRLSLAVATMSCRVILGLAIVSRRLGLAHAGRCAGGHLAISCPAYSSEPKRTTEEEIRRMEEEVRAMEEENRRMEETFEKGKMVRTYSKVL